MEEKDWHPTTAIIDSQTTKTPLQVQKISVLTEGNLLKEESDSIL
ncbi:hypothetical protein [uncultured Chryseobacterium sp.]|nr:hypothetical protein [uncultured Chryseobacterium sp.]